MLMIILGAGASYDSYSSRLPSTDSKDLGRPPLANELFGDRDYFNELLHKYGQCREILPQLRGQPALEELLERLQEEAKTFLHGQQQLMAVKYYIRAAIECYEEQWRSIHRGATSHLALLNRIERWRKSKDRSVAIVTFNYDTIMEEALSSYLNYRFNDLAHYIEGHDYKLFKLHGSVNWGHLTRVQMSHLESMSMDKLEQRIIEWTGSTGVQIYPDRFRMQSEALSLMQGGYALLPALAIPVKRKDSFSCPKEHLTELEKVIPNVDRILSIGWRGQEQHFLNYLSKVSETVRVLVVAKNSTEAKQTALSMKKGGVRGNYIEHRAGFSNLIINHETLDEFLYDKANS